LIVGFGCLIAFVFIEAAVSPMVPLTLFASRSFTGRKTCSRLFLYAAIGIFFFLFR